MKRSGLLSALLLTVVIAGSAGCRAGELPVVRVATQAAATAEAISATATALRDDVVAVSAAPTAVVPPAEANAAVRLATESLAERLNLRPEFIRLMRVEVVDWPDTSLGCPHPDKVYAQVITPGFRVLLWARGIEYEYHTDEGRFVAWCD